MLSQTIKRQTMSIDISERFQWLEIEGRHILHMNVTNASEKELLAMLYKTTEYTHNPPAGADKLYCLLENEGGASFTLRVFKESIAYLRNYACFEISAGYGKFDAVWIAASKIQQTVLRRKTGLFKTKEKALKFVLTESK